MGSFRPLVFGTNGGMGVECQMFLRHLAEELSKKDGEPYAAVITVTFKGSQDIRLPELTSTRTKFNSLPRGSKGQSIAQAHKGFFIRPNNFITKQSGSGVAVLRLCVELCCGSN